MTARERESSRSLTSLKSHLTRSYTIPFLSRVSAWIERLAPGDRAIFTGLSVLVVCASLLSVYALESRLLVRIPSYGGSLKEGEVGSPRFVNPLLAISDSDRDLAMLTYAGLMGVSGSGALTPVLAQTYTVSPDGKVYTFTLRDNAVFSDGSKVTANDVVFTVQKAQDPTIKSPQYADWSGIQVTAIDEHTVQFTLPKPYAPFLELTTLGILPAHLWQSISDEQFPFSDLDTNPVGAGPFVLTGSAHDSNGLITSVTLSANKKYALGRPYLDSITFTFYQRAEDLSRAVANGSVESAYGVPSATSLTAPYARVFGVFWNPSVNTIYARAEVRKALSLALDRSSIIDTVLHGYATPIMGPVPPGSSVQQVPVSTSDNPTADAAAVLTQAGWSYDGGARLWVNGKATLDNITIRTSNVPELKNVASAVKSDWEKLGIPVSIELYEPGDLSQNVIRPRKYEALLYGMVIGRDQDLYAFWDSQERNDPGLNIALYANKNVDALLEDARTSADPQVRAADLQKIEDTIASEYPAAFIYAPDFVYTVPSDLKGVVLPQITTPADRFASVTKWYRATDAVWPLFAHQ